jgi:hypothetical protein
MLRILLRSAGLFLLATVFATGTAAAQRGQFGLEQIDQNANFTRVQLQRLLQQYPPSFGEVLRLDPSLLTNSDYMKPYPALSSFLDQHSEIARNPAFFLGPARLFAGNFRQDPIYREREISRDMLEMMAIFVVVLTVIGALTWIIRTVIDHRRWIRMSKVQTEAHSKLLDRLTSNEDLLAYIQTPAGRRFLESTPIESGMQVNAPISRIMWSIQAGLVLGAGGIGMQFVSGNIDTEVAQPFFILGVLALALGIGFVFSALVSYAISRRMGLIDHSATTTPPS